MNQGKSLRCAAVRGPEVVWTVEINFIDFLAIDERGNVERLVALRNRLRHILGFERYILVLRRLVAFDLVLGLNGLAGRFVNVLSMDAISRRSVDYVQRDTLRRRGRGVERHRTSDFGDLQESLPRCSRRQRFTLSHSTLGFTSGRTICSVRPAARREHLSIVQRWPLIENLNGMATMTTIYRVERAGDQWSVWRNGKLGMTYLTQEAAFEIATAEAGSDLRSGDDILIAVTAATDPAAARRGGGQPIEGDLFTECVREMTVTLTFTDVGFYARPRM